jgi:hypothetical protein
MNRLLSIKGINKMNLMLIIKRITSTTLLLVIKEIICKNDPLAPSQGKISSPTFEYSEGNKEDFTGDYLKRIINMSSLLIIKDILNLTSC